MTLAEEARHTVTDIRAARLEPRDWDGVMGALDDLAGAATVGDEAAARAALLVLSRTAFAGKVRQRMPAGGRGAPAVVPTKQTAALPVVGVVCGGLLLGVGWLLGGGLVLAGSAVFAVFVLVIAVAGSMVVHDRQHPEGTVDPTVIAPAQVVAAADLALVAVTGGIGAS